MARIGRAVSLRSPRRAGSPFLVVVVVTLLYQFVRPFRLDVVVHASSSSSSSSASPPYQYYNEDDPRRRRRPGYEDPSSSSSFATNPVHYQPNWQEEASYNDDSSPPPPVDSASNRNNNENRYANSYGSPPPPPPPPLSRQPGTEGAAAIGRASTAGYYTPPPIHYQFPSKAADAVNDNDDTNVAVAFRDDVEEEENEDGDARYPRQQQRRRRQSPETRGDPSSDTDTTYASARRDVLTRYMDRSRWHRLQVRAAAGGFGAACGTFVGTSLLGTSSPSVGWTAAALGGGVAYVAAHVRTPYGELCRSAGYVGVTVWYDFWRHIRRTYPTAPHVRAVLGAGPRRPFPPGTDNPWQYRSDSIDDNRDDDSPPPRPPFTMIYAVLAMTFLGSLCGGHVPLVPSWMGALGGAGLAGLLTTRPTARGDLARCLGMRAVAVLQAAWRHQQAVALVPQMLHVARLWLDRALVWDRQHGIRDRIVAWLTWVYTQVRALVGQIQQQSQQQTPQARRGPPSMRGNEGPRRRPAEDDRRPRRRRYHDDEDYKRDTGEYDNDDSSEAEGEGRRARNGRNRDGGEMEEDVFRRERRGNEDDDDNDTLQEGRQDDPTRRRRRRFGF